MKKLFYSIILVCAIFAMCFITHKTNDIDYIKSWHHQSALLSIADAIEKHLVDWKEVRAGEKEMQIVYQLAKRSIVKVAVGDAAGSGVIWNIGDDQIIIAASKHLLMKGMAAEVTFCNRETANAIILGVSQQYDIGILSIKNTEVSQKALGEIYEAVPILACMDVDWDRERFLKEYAESDVLQIGADLGSGTNFSIGQLTGISFEPLFYTYVLETACYSKAGMSGGGVFDKNGRFLGLISGGDVPEEASVREAETTYSIPAWLVEQEYGIILADIY